MAALLNDLLARTVQPRLVGHEGIPLHLHVDAPGASWGGWLAASGAMALALLIAEHGTGVLGECQARGCAHVLLRTGPGPARRFCDNACASRTRVAVYRASRTACTVRKASDAETSTGQKQAGARDSRPDQGETRSPHPVEAAQRGLDFGRGYLTRRVEHPSAPASGQLPRTITRS